MKKYMCLLLVVVLLATINTGSDNMATLQDYLGITKLRDAWPKWKDNAIAINNQVIAHVAGTADKHAAQNVTYSGEVNGETEVKGAVDSLQQQVNNLSFTGSEHDALVTAALVDIEDEDFGPEGENTGLNGRLDKWETKHNTHLADYATLLINVKYPGHGLIAAVGDGITDDTLALQAILDYVYNKGGGKIYHPLGIYKTTKPLIIKTVTTELSGYDFPTIIISGEANTGTTIKKIGTDTLYSLDATCILIKGSTLNINDGWTGVIFENIKIKNDSTAAITYAVYGKIGSRIICEYTSFSVLKDYATIDTHDRYALYIGTGFAWSFKNCTFHGDYGFYSNASCTSLTLENCYASTDKIAYHINGIYSTLINVYGDFCKGTMFHFYYANVHCTSIGGESPDCDRFIKLDNSNVTIDNTYLIQSNLDTGEVIFGNGSSLKIKQMTVEMGATNKGYLWNGGTYFDLEIEKLRLTVNTASRFKYSAAAQMGANINRVYVSPDENPTIRGMLPLIKFMGSYWDWYVETPIYTMNNIILGLKTPTLGSDGTNFGGSVGGVLNAFYLNANVLERNVLGWTRYAQTATTLSNGSNYYVPLILAGDTASRPTWQVAGMQYFDTTLNKPIWCKTPHTTTPVWVDGAGTTV